MDIPYFCEGAIKKIFLPFLFGFELSRNYFIINCFSTNGRKASFPFLFSLLFYLLSGKVAKGVEKREE